MKTCKEELVPTYNKTEDDDTIVAKALGIVTKRLKKTIFTASSPASVKTYLTLTYGNSEKEVFSVLWLDTQHRVKAFEEVSLGTLNQASVYPREMVKSALKHNAAACILAHNHPSGLPEPSQADITLTNSLRTVLALVDVKVLDHIIVGGADTISFAERGLL